MAMDLTDEARGGFDAWINGTRDPPYFHSSDSWLAWHAGAALARTGRTKPHTCKKSRGYSVRLDTAVNRFTFKAAGPDLMAFDLERHG